MTDENKHLNLVSFPTAKDEFVESSVKVLEETLDDARNGRVHSVAIAYINHAGAVTIHNSESNKMETLIGAVSYLQFNMNKNLDQNYVDLDEEDGAQ